MLSGEGFSSFHFDDNEVIDDYVSKIFAHGFVVIQNPNRLLRRGIDI